MSIQLEEGKYYLDRAGNVRGPMKLYRSTSGDEESIYDFVDNIGDMYMCDGSFYGDGEYSSYDLIAEVPPSLINRARPSDKPNSRKLSAPSPVEEPASTEQPDVKASILAEAGKIVNGARRSAYGTPERNFERIARFWQAYFENTGRGDVKITAADVSPLMRLMKEARLCESPQHRDSFVDIIGYAMTGAEVNGVPAEA